VGRFMNAIAPRLAGPGVKAWIWRFGLLIPIGYFAVFLVAFCGANSANPILRGLVWLVSFGRVS